MNDNFICPHCDSNLVDYKNNGKDFLVCGSDTPPNCARYGYYVTTKEAMLHIRDNVKKIKEGLLDKYLFDNNYGKTKSGKDL